MKIYKYLNYRDFLQNALEEFTKQDDLSLREVATKIDIDHSVLSRVLNGKRKLPLELISNICKVLNLESIEEEYFTLLVEEEHVTSPRAKKLLNDEIRLLHTQRNLPKLEKETFNLVADFTTLSLLELLQVESIPRTPQNYALQLGITEEQVIHSLDQLVKAQILSFNNGEYKKIKDNVNFKTNASDKEVESFFNSALSEAQNDLIRGKAENRIFRTRIAAIPKSMRKEFCLQIDSMLGKLHINVQNHQQEKDDLICLNINFFGLLKDVNNEPTHSSQD